MDLVEIMLILVIGLAFGFLLGLAVGETSVRGMQEEAVRARAGEFYLDANFNRQFRFKGEGQ